LQQFGASAFYTVVHWQTRWGGQWAYLTYFYHLGYLYAKNYQICWNLMKFRQKQVRSFFGTPCTTTQAFLTHFVRHLD